MITFTAARDENLIRRFGGPAMLASVILLSACGGGSGGSDGPSGAASSSSTPSVDGSGTSSSVSDDTPILVNSPEALSKAIDFEGAARMGYSIPAPSGASGGVLDVSQELSVTAGGTSQLSIRPSLEEGYYVHAYMIQLDGVEETFIIPADSQGKPVFSSSTLLAASDLPGKVESHTQKSNTTQEAAVADGLTRRLDDVQLNCSGRTSINFELSDYSASAQVQAYVQPEPSAWTMDFETFKEGMSVPLDYFNMDYSSWTQPAEVEIKAVDVGTGELQVTLAWDTSADVDLHLEEPGGHTIHYLSPNSNNGDGYLDIDDVDGYGPENIFYDINIPSGDYTIKVHLFSGPVYGESITSYTVTLKQNGTVNTYTGTLNSWGEVDIITSFTVNGTGATSGQSSGGGATGSSNTDTAGSGSDYYNSGNNTSGQNGGNNNGPNTDYELGACGVKQYGFLDICYTNYPAVACELLADEMAGLADVITYQQASCGSGYNCDVNILTFDGENLPSACLE
ncbi:YfaP family protein [Gilvimarinus sp. 1_MG-2023]|uniref:YfaP family protein n=1 Tax=Gilvimarinus sp. 1_MG-2023 TaxID=3062638 RepID=UPI0026E3259A|nr:hypothetical protein [Gilvimarinus sp. 1_MG-2023]MDO6748432.1 hypothetical protein [Gilvimarinus sp. 1_MG-2023]